MPYIFNEKLQSALQHVHPLQAESVSNLIKCGFPPEVNYVVLFGGSLLLTCHPYSDLDLYLLGDTDLDIYDLRAYFKGIRKKVGKPVDILYSTIPDFLEQKEVLGSIENRVWKDGVVIYAKRTSDTVR